MASLEENLQELEHVKQAFKDNFDNYGVSTSGVEFRNMPNLLVQMEKILPSQVKEVTPTKERQVVNPDEGFKMTGTVVNPIPDEYIVPTGVKSITENGTYDVSDFATAQVDVAGESATLVTKEITENGTYNATDDNADGYSSVVVNVPSLKGNPIEVATDEEMTNALTEANLGKVYKFTGTSSTYETDAIYIVSEVE